MTNEEAIKNIVAYMYYSDDIPEEVVKSFDVAIKALKQIDKRIDADTLKKVMSCLGLTYNEIEKIIDNYEKGGQI